MSSCNKEEIGGTYGITISGNIDGHDYVDLGLSVKWATKNIGASRSSDSGDFFAWGEIKPKSSFNLDNYKWYDNSENCYTKYYSTTDNCIIDNKTNLDPNDDAAHELWGRSWRIPTREEIDELRSKCDWWFLDHNGVYGCLLIGPNGNRIFFPYQCSCWSSSNDSEYPDKAYFFAVTEGSYVFSIPRYIGKRIRPVTDK